MTSTKDNYFLELDRVNLIFENVLNEIFTNPCSREETALHSFYIKRSDSSESIYFDGKLIPEGEIGNREHIGDQSFIRDYLIKKAGRKEHLINKAYIIRMNGSRYKLYWTLSSECLDEHHGTLILNCLLRQSANKFNELIFDPPESYCKPFIHAAEIIRSVEKDIEGYLQGMFEPFKKEYNRMKKKNGSKEINNWEDKIADSYDNYFVALNALVNSTMHNERQFVQATAFNAVFYSVPPKIMAFYNAYIYRVKQILMDKRCKNQFTLLIYPSFSPTIMLEQISLDEAPPCDRILTVKISEESLYDIESVMYQFVHELAHQVGTDLRSRKEHTQQIDDILLRWVIQHCGIKNDTYQILKQKISLSNSASQQCEDTNNGGSKPYEREYLQYVFQNGITLLWTLNSLQDFGKYSAKYFLGKKHADKTYYDPFLESCGIRKEDQKAYVENYGTQYDKLKCRDFKAHLRIMDDHEQEIKYKRYIELILWVYRECYADLQMILVLAMNAEDYLNTFLIGQKIPIRALLSRPRDLLRICTIFRVMTDCGLWKAPAEQDNEGYQLICKLFNQYNGKIAANTEANRIYKSKRKVTALMEDAKAFDFENGIRLKESLSKEHIASIRQAASEPMANPLVDLAAGLYEYLLIVMGKSLKEYSNKDKLSQIREVRALIQKILAFEDATEIFNCVEAELDYYKREGCKIHPKKK